MNMIEVKTADLSGAALDWAVGTAAGIELKGFAGKGFGVYIPSENGFVKEIWSPSTDWAQCGSLIDKYRPDIQTNSDGQIAAYLNNSLSDPEPLAIGRGDTYLIAVCRAIVAAKLGDTVQVPAELVEVVQ